MIIDFFVWTFRKGGASFFVVCQRKCFIQKMDEPIKSPIFLLFVVEVIFGDIMSEKNSRNII